MTDTTDKAARDKGTMSAHGIQHTSLRTDDELRAYGLHIYDMRGYAFDRDAFMDAFMTAARFNINPRYDWTASEDCSLIGETPARPSNYERKDCAASWNAETEQEYARMCEHMALVESGNACRACGEACTLEGWDGYCGSCADRLETTGSAHAAGCMCDSCIIERDTRAHNALVAECAAKRAEDERLEQVELAEYRAEYVQAQSDSLAMTKSATVESLPVGEYVKRKRDASKVYKRGAYDRSQKRYELHDESDISRSIFVKRGTVLFFDFLY